MTYYDNDVNGNDDDVVGNDCSDDYDDHVDDDGEVFSHWVISLQSNRPWSRK